MKVAVLYAIFGGLGLLVCLQTVPVTSAQAQSGTPTASVSCGAANGGGPNSTNYYGNGNPCAFRYSVPEENLNRLLNEVHYCSMYSRTQVNCSQAIRGNYGQIQLDANGNAPASVGNQGVSAEQLWQRALVLIDRNNYRDALPLLMQAGKMGHVRAQATLGIAYQNGNGVRVDDKAAAYWFGLASAQGHRAAQYALGGMYEEGEGGLIRDQKKATELHLASAKQGFDKAELMVGVDYLTGDGGLPNDRRQAIFWLQKAAAQGADYARSLTIILADKSAPTQFANMNALGQYLLMLNQEEMARAAAAPNGSAYLQDSNVVARINASREHNQWLADHGSGNGGNSAPSE
jgi:TPR repeat protein